MDQKTPKVEVQGVRAVYETVVPQSQDTLTAIPGQESQNGLDEFLTFDNAKANGVKQEPEEMETEQSVADEAETEEENVDVVFEVNGHKINACMSASMAQMLKDSEEMRLQVIDKIMAEAENNPDQQITIATAEPSSVDTSATESADSPIIKKEPGVSQNVHSPLNGQAMLGNRAVTTVIGNKSITGNKVVTRGSTGIVKPKLVSPSNFRQTHPVKPIGRTSMGSSAAKPFVWDHKAVVALIECYKTVNDKLVALKATKNINMWTIVGKRMRARGFNVSDLECERKFHTLTYAFKTKKKDSSTGKTPPWEYYKSMETALVEPKPKPKSNPNPKPVPVITVDDESPIASDAEDFAEEDDKADPAAKKSKLDLDASAIDKFRMTFLRVETAKLREMKAARKVQQEQCKLQKERNEILNSIAQLLGQK